MILSFKITVDVDEASFTRLYPGISQDAMAVTVERTVERSLSGCSLAPLIEIEPLESRS